MAYIRSRKSPTGRVTYIAEIKRTSKGVIVHQESKSFSSEEIAKAWVKKREAHIELNGIPEKKPEVTLSSLSEKYTNEYGSMVRMGRTKKQALEQLKTFSICDIDIEKLTSSDYMDHINQRINQDKVKPQTANNDIVWFKVLLDFAIVTTKSKPVTQELESAKAFLRSSGMIGRSEKRNRLPTTDEQQMLIDRFNRDDGRRQIPMMDIFLFAMYSARRQSEITRIRWDDNNEEFKTGIVRDAKHPRMKKGNHRTFNYTNEAWEIIQRQPRTDEFIFPYNSRTISSYFTRTCKFLEIEDLRFHDYRHLATSWLFTQKLSIQEVSQHTLHESWDMLKRYTHLSEEEKAQIESVYKVKTTYKAIA